MVLFIWCHCPFTPLLQEITKWFTTPEKSAKAFAKHLTYIQASIVPIRIKYKTHRWRSQFRQNPLQKMHWFSVLHCIMSIWNKIPPFYVNIKEHNYKKKKIHYGLPIIQKCIRFYQSNKMRCCHWNVQSILFSFLRWSKQSHSLCVYLIYLES